MLKIYGATASIPGLCFSQPSGAALDRIRTLLPKTIEDWDLWLECVTLNGLESLILNTVLRDHVTLPKWVYQSLEESCLRQRVISRNRQASLAQFLRTLAHEKIPFIVLGADPFTKELLGDSVALAPKTLRLLLQPNDLAKLPRIFSKLNYTSPALLEKKPWLRKMSISHWPSYLNADHSLAIKIYWSTDQNQAFERVSDWGYWKNAESFDEIEYSGLRLSKEDFLHYLCLEISPYGVSMVDLALLLNALQEWKGLDWGRLSSLIKTSASADSVYRALSLCQNVIYRDSVQGFLDELSSEVSRRVKNEMLHISESPESILWSNPVPITHVRSLSEDLILTQNPMEKLMILWRMAKAILSVSPVQMARMHFQTPPTGMLERVSLKITGPFTIFKAILYQLGWKQLLLEIWLLWGNFLKSLFLPSKKYSLPPDHLRIP